MNGNFKLRTVDYIIIAGAILLLLVGLLIGFKLNKFSKSPVKKEAEIAIQVFLRNVVITSNRNPILKGDLSHITIRNVPYTKLKVMDVVTMRKSVVLPVPSQGKSASMIEDVSMPFQYDMIITLVDKAKITEDGPVAGGNKIKIGVPIVLEGVDYKLNGVISAVELVDNLSKSSAPTVKQK